MILNRDLRIVCTDHVIDRMKERFLTFDLLAIERVMQKGRAVYDPERESFRVEHDTITIVVQQKFNRKKVNNANLVVTVFFREARKKDLRKNRTKKIEKPKARLHKLKKQIEPTIKSECEL